ncbi:Tubulin-specific chaperone B [Echinococcus granulosus]|uniref:Tubulin-specific chaperone B n=2 Tax=Echinococcus granulosus TaxID=6210 RepID=W6UID2_ECHGR|nr:Tubulin-specific chaperone B [Echinococcus granulosus]EUB61230.1 Tubulin-specific chaperone B [Echinococcus granulosus]
MTAWRITDWLQLCAVDGGCFEIVASIGMASKPYISLLISSSATAMSCEKHFPLSMLLSRFKENIVLITGCDNKTMKLELRDENEKFVKELTDDSKALEELGLKNGFHVHVTDPTVEAGLYDNILRQDMGDRFKLSDEQYAGRKNTFLAWKKQYNLGEFREIDPEERKAAEEAKLAKEAADRKLIESMKIGDRCEVRVPKQPARRGEIAFLGETKFKEGIWVGVKYDEPLGRNDGSVDGYRYFECQPKYGAFVKPHFVEVGDFPELGLDDLDEI